MRKAQKRDILELVDTLYQAHEEIKQYIAARQNTHAQEMLGQCQECAISIGTTVEKLERADHAAVSFAEEYCELLYRIYEELNTGEANSNRVGKALHKHLLKLENSIKNDIKVRKEVAFFPYKASMWDALESVYYAAKNDPDCDAYCVPIPYYDRNPDGSLGAMHDERDQYPNDVETMDWQAYNFEERKPDIIYIHNPYDNCNLITCIHPRFFSKNLKLHTKALIYIPYFILEEIEPGNQSAIDEIKHFCFLPGIINADRVIVQSENMRRIYISEYAKQAKLCGLGREHTDKEMLLSKFLGMGSPKYDKAACSEKSFTNLPSDWQGVIRKKDGSRKKIIFYNTSVSALLAYSEKMLEKMERVFALFRERQEQTALLWRPHPLIQSTVSSMRPQLWAKYEEILKKYREEGFGIYDDSSDLNRAIAVSDGYYGDASSVVQLYKNTGKPVLMQTAGEDDYFYQLFFYDWLWEEQSIIYPAVNYNAICRTDLLSGETSVIGKAEEGDHTLLFVGIYRWEDALMFSSRNARPALVFYQEDIRKWTYIDVEEDKRDWLDFREEDVFAHGRYLYIFPNVFVVLKADMQQKTVTYLYFPDIKPGDELRGETEQVGQNIYIPARHSSKIYKFNLATEQIQICRIDTKLQGIDTLCFDGELFWMTGGGQMLVSWDEESGRCVSYHEFPPKFCKFTEREGEDGWWFSQSFFYGNSIYLTPSYSNMVIEMDLRSNRMREIFIEGEEEDEASAFRAGRCHQVKYGMSKLRGHSLMLLSAKNKNLILMDLRTKEVKKIEYYIRCKDDADLLAATGLNDSVLDLNDWLIQMERFKRRKEGDQAVQERIGENIYAALQE